MLLCHKKNYCSETWCAHDLNRQTNSQGVDLKELLVLIEGKHYCKLDPAENNSSKFLYDPYEILKPLGATLNMTNDAVRRLRRMISQGVKLSAKSVQVFSEAS